MDVRLRLESGCDLSMAGNGLHPGSGLLDFGKATSMDTAEATAVQPSGTAVLRVACSRDFSGANAPALLVDGGLHAQQGQRRLAGPGREYIDYQLYADRAMKTPWPVSVPLQLAIPENGVAQVLLQGRVRVPEDALYGRYTDTVFLTLVF